MRRSHIIIGGVVLLLSVALLSAAAYLLHYALQPEREAVADTWARLYREYPDTRPWHDSLVHCHALRDTTITAKDGTHLHAFYVRNPRSQGRTAVLVHGYTDNAVRMMHLGRMYERELGYNILLPDLRYAGTSGGTHIQMGWLDRLDVQQWVALLPRLFSLADTSEADNLRVVVHGISMGAATTMMLSGEPQPPYVRAFVEDCGFTSVEAQFEKELGEQFHLPAFPLLPLASWMCDVRFGWNFTEASALEAVKRCRRPMLFIHGTADDYVPTEMVHPLYAAHPGPKKLWLAPEAAHAEAYHDHPQAYRDTLSCFLNTYL